MVVLLIGLIGSCLGGKSDDSKKETTKAQVSQGNPDESQGTELEETTSPIEYIPVTADELSEALSSNAMKAQNDYKGQYLEITGKLGNIDSNGKYIGIDTESFSMTNIQCYLKTDEHKEVIMEMSKGDAITVKGYCKDIGEILGYQIDIDEVYAE